MPPPAGRVLAVTFSLGLSPVKHCFYAAANSRGGLWLRDPYRLEHLQHEFSVDAANLLITKYRVNEGRQRILPLLPVLGILPGRLMRVDECLGALAEGHGRSICELRLRPLMLARVDRVDALSNEITCPSCEFPRLGEA